MNTVESTLYAIVKKMEAEPGLNNIPIHNGWPVDKNFALPAISIIAFKSEFLPSDRRIQKYSKIQNDQFVDIIVGHYDFPINVNVWARTKTERGKIDEIIKNLFFERSNDILKYEPCNGIFVEIPPFGDLVNIRLTGERTFDDISTGEGYFRRLYEATCRAPYKHRHTLNNNPNFNAEVIIK